MAPVEPACECVLGDGVAVPLEEKDEESERGELLSGLYGGISGTENNLVSDNTNCD